MKKKLNLVLRDPVKLHNNNRNIAELPSPFDKKDNENQEFVKESQKISTAKASKDKPKQVEETGKSKVAVKPKIESKKAALPDVEITDVRKEMSLRIRQVWEYFCIKANADNELKNSFTVTRAEVMSKAGIGSTNTYRDALKRMQNLGLIRIELRPGVNAGSVFYLTKDGLDQAKLFLREN